MMSKKNGVFTLIAKIFSALLSKPPAIDSPPSRQSISFSVLPNGHYLVKYVDEKISEGEYIIGIFEVVYGEFRGSLVPMKFDNAAAKRTTLERSGNWIEYLAYGENDKRAMDLMYLYEEPEFLVSLKDGHVRWVLQSHDEAILRYKRKH